MKAYNIYYKNEKVNSKPLAIDDVNNILLRDTIVMKTRTNKEETVNVRDLRIIKCTIL